MSAFDAENRGVAAVGRFRSLLLELLDEASAAKRTTTVEPAVNKADIKDLQLRLSSALATEGGAINGKPIFGDAAAKQDDAKAAADTAKETGQQVDIAKAESFKEEADALKAAADAVKLRQFAIIETATRDLFDELIATTPIDSPSFVKMWNLLDIVSILSDDGQCEPALLFWLVEELLDSQTIDGCRAIFDYLESRRDRITAKKFEQKKLVILRSCNELLRRLSRAEDTAFCGRVFIFMFQSFPLGDRSSVNLRGEYHVENITAYDIQPASDGANMDVDSQVEDRKDPTESKPSVKPGVSDAKDSQKPLSPDALYPLFWSLQESFSQPLKLFQATNFSKFRESLGATVTAFEAIANEDESRASRSLDEASRLKRKSGQSHDAPESYAPKYLTSRDLFELEISDLSFRRHVLVQALIILDFLLSFTKAGKERMSAVPRSNRSMMYSDELNDEDAKWTNDMKERIASYLRSGLDGPYFYRTVETVLARDKNWVIWKMAGCPPIQRDPVAPAIFIEAKMSAQRMATHKRLRPTPIGAVSFDFLRDKDEESALEKLRDPKRYQLPELDDFKSRIAEDDFEIEMATNERTKAQAIAGKSSKTWRALRIAGRCKLAAFDKIDDPQNVGIIFQDLQELEDADGDAEPAASAEDMPSNREPLVIAGPTAVGKSAVMEKLMEENRGVFGKVIRHTTREALEGEVKGKTFHFVEPQAFNQLRDSDRLIEHGNRDGVDYGTSSAAVDSITEAGKVPIVELDIEAAKFAKDMGFAARYILIKPNSRESLQARLEKSDNDAAAAKAAAEKLWAELAAVNVNELFAAAIVNDDLNIAAKELLDVVYQTGSDAQTGT